MRTLALGVLLLSACLGVVALPPYPPPDIIAQVIRVVDGDTIVVKILSAPEKYGIQPNAEVKVRYIGVEAPELHQSAGPIARDLNQLLVAERVVYLELDLIHWDEYGRLLAYVYLDPLGYLMVNLALIATPICRTREHPGNNRYAWLFEQVDRASLAPSPCPSPHPLTLEFVEIRSPVRPGQDGRVVVRTAPGAQCQITVVNPSGGISEAKGLEPKTADQSGLVVWEWKIGTRTKPGVGRIRVNATLCGRSVEKTIPFVVSPN